MAIEYTEGSYAGIKIKVERSTLQFGRRIHVIEADGRQVTEEGSGQKKKWDGSIEDVGRKIQSLTLDIYLTEEDLPERRDQLIERLNQSSIAELKLPSLGSVRVVPEISRLVSNRAQIDYETLQVTFWIPPEEDFVAAQSVATQFVVSEQAASLSDELARAFDEQWESSVPDYVEEAEAEAVSETADTIEQSVSIATKTIQGASDLAERVDEIRNEAIALIRAPGEFIDRIRGIANSITSAVTDTAQALRSQFAILTNIDTGWRGISIDTPSRASERANMLNTEIAFKTACLSEIALIYAETEFDSFADASASVKEITAAADEILDLVTGEEVALDIFQSLKSLISATNRDLIDRAANLPPVVLYTSLDQQPVLVTSFNLYGSVEQYQQIIDRNSVRNPLFPKQTLEVIRQ